MVPQRVGDLCPRQIEFARLNLNYTVMSKRKLIKLVREGHVRGWDDPRMLHPFRMRRRGFYLPRRRSWSSSTAFGVAKNFNVVDVSLLEEIVRDMLKPQRPAQMAILRPLKLVIDILF